jgi:WD40 repeat protein
MNTKRRIEWFLLPVVIIAAISSCQPTSTPTPTEQPSPTAIIPTSTVSPSPTATEDPCGQMPPSELGGTRESQPPLIPSGPVPEGAVLRLGKGRVYTLATAPDGQTIAIATATGLTMFSIPDLQELWSVSYLTYPMVGGFYWVKADQMQFSQDGSILKASKEAEDLYFDAQDGTLLEPEMIPGDQSFIEPVRSECLSMVDEGSEIFHQATSVDGAFVAITRHSYGLIEVFDNSTCTLLNEMYIGGSQHFLSWLPARPGECGGALLTVSVEGMLGIWDPWSGEQIRAGALGTGYQLAWSPDGSTLAVGADSLAVLVDVDTMAVADVFGGDRMHRFWPAAGQGYYEGVASINWDSNDRLVVGGHHEILDAAVMIWTPQTGAEWYVLPDTGLDFVLSPDGQLLASESSNGFDLWEVHSGALLRTVEVEYCRQKVWSPDGTRLVCTSHSHGQIVVFDVDTGQPVGVFPQSSWPIRLAWSPDGDYLALTPDLDIIVWDIERDEHYTLEGGYLPVWSPDSWSPDGRWIARAVADGTVLIWGLEQRALTHTLEGHIECVNVMAWSPDSTLLAIGYGDNTITIFDVAEERPVKQLEGHVEGYVLDPRGVVDLAWSPDGRWLASVGGDLTLIIWDVSQIGQ